MNELSSEFAAVQLLFFSWGRFFAELVAAWDPRQRCPTRARNSGLGWVVLVDVARLLWFGGLCPAAVLCDVWFW